VPSAAAAVRRAGARGGPASSALSTLGGLGLVAGAQRVAALGGEVEPPVELADRAQQRVALLLEVDQDAGRARRARVDVRAAPSSGTAA
jgi:hypothetical protein